MHTQSSTLGLTNVVARLVTENQKDGSSNSIFSVLLTPAGITASSLFVVTLIIIFCLLCIPDLRHRCCRCSRPRARKKETFALQDRSPQFTYHADFTTWQYGTPLPTESSLHLLPAQTGSLKMPDRGLSRDRWHGDSEIGVVRADTVSERAADGSWRHTMYANVPLPDKPAPARTISRQHERARTPSRKRTWQR